MISYVILSVPWTVNQYKFEGFSDSYLKSMKRLMPKLTLHNDFISDPVSPVEISDWTDVVALIRLVQAVDAQGTIGEDLETIQKVEEFSFIIWNG